MGLFKKIFGFEDKNPDTSVTCKKCGVTIQPSTAKTYDGECAPCASCRDIVKEERQRAEEKRQREERERLRKEQQQKWESLLDLLPQKALLAFEARCVRRMYSLLECVIINTFPEINDCIKREIANAERVAGGTVLFKHTSDIKKNDLIFFSFDILSYVTMWERFMHVPPRLALVAKEYETQGEKFSIQSISEILVDIENVFLGGIFGTCPKEFTNRISCDLKLLKKKTMNENWMDNTPVPAAIFGPLWPNGAPAGWPV